MNSVHKIIENNKEAIKHMADGREERVFFLEGINDGLAVSAKFSIPHLPDEAILELSRTAFAYSDEGLLDLPYSQCYFEYDCGGYASGVYAEKVSSGSVLMSAHQSLDMKDAGGTIAWKTSGAVVMWDPANNTHSIGYTDKNTRDFMGEDTPDGLKDGALNVIRMVYAFIVLINSPAVMTEKEDAPAKLNKRREAKGKTPLYSHHVVKIGAVSHTGGLVKHGGSHASPRQHWRRGHVRTLNRDSESERKILIPATLIAGRGFVSKDYVVDNLN